MKNVFVIGDSFCAWRSEEYDWPVLLANLLNLKLVGTGIPGGSWWFIRKKFLELLNTEDYINSELVIFCHTEPNRLIGSESTIHHNDPKLKDILQTYLMHFQNVEFNHWVCNQWFNELNNIIKNKKVIHIQNFDVTKKYFSTLNGIRLATPSLLTLSMKDADTNNARVLINDNRHNHFSEKTNKKLAYFLANLYLQNKNNWDSKNMEIVLNDL